MHAHRIRDENSLIHQDNLKTPSRRHHVSGLGNINGNTTVTANSNTKNNITSTAPRKALGEIGNRLDIQGNSTKAKKTAQAVKKDKLGLGVAIHNSNNSSVKKIQHKKFPKTPAKTPKKSFVYVDKPKIALQEDQGTLDDQDYEIEYAPPPEKEEPKMITELDGVMEELLKPVYFSDNVIDLHDNQKDYSSEKVSPSSIFDEIPTRSKVDGLYDLDNEKDFFSGADDFAEFLGEEDDFDLLLEEFEINI